MKKSRQKNIWKETLLNKAIALGLLLLGVLSAKVSNDITVLVFTLMLSLPLFFTKENWITKD